MDDGFEPELAPELVRSLRTERGAVQRLETATVRALFARGLLHNGAPPRIRWMRMGGAAAAAAAVFLVGVAAGRHSAPRPAAVTAAAKAAAQSGEPLSVQVSRAALQYIEALSRVPPNDSTLRELALLSLRTAGDQISRIAPESDIALAIRLVSPAPAIELTHAGTPVLAQSNLIWY
jgi:hypothetical protein